MSNLKLTTALVASLAIAAPAFAGDNTSAKSEEIIPQTGEVTNQANADGEAPIDNNARQEAVDVDSEENPTVAESDNNARFSAVTPGVDKDTMDEDDTGAVAVTKNETTEGMVEGTSNDNARYDEVTPDNELSGSEGEQTDNARLDAVTPDTELSGSEGVQTDNARYDAVTPEDKAMMTADAQLEGARVYDANNNWIGEISEVNQSSAVIDVGGFLGIGEKPVLLEWSQLDILKERDSNDIRVYTKMTEAELEAMPTYQN